MLRLSLCFTFLTALVAGCATDEDSCPTSVAEFCDTAIDTCPMTWTAAQDVASWRCGPGTDGFVTLSTCGDVHVATVAYIDAGKDYYYDSGGQLYRIESFVNLQHECAAGTGHALPGKNSTSCDPDPVTLCSPY